MAKYFFIILYAVLIGTIATSCNLSNDMTPISLNSLTNHFVITNTSTSFITNTLQITITNISTNIYTNDINSDITNIKTNIITNNITNVITNTLTNIVTNMMDGLSSDALENIRLVENLFPRRNIIYQKIYGEKPNILYENFYIYNDERVAIIQSGIQNNICFVSGFLGDKQTFPINSVSIKKASSSVDIDKSLYSGYVFSTIKFDMGALIFNTFREENTIEQAFLMKIESSTLRVIPLINLGIFYQIAGKEKIYTRIP
ncbi:MAG: hypothetical protein ACRC9L_02340 [Brevinema sp.]